MARAGVAVTGYREFLKACAQGEPNTRKYVREAFRDVGEVVRADAAARFQSIDSKTAAGYRVRVRQRGVAVAQSLKKVDGKHGQYGGLQMAKALRPAVKENEPEIGRRMVRALDKIADRFESTPRRPHA